MSARNERMPRATRRRTIRRRSLASAMEKLPFADGYCKPVRMPYAAQSFSVTKPEGKNRRAADYVSREARHVMTVAGTKTVSYTHLRAHETDSYLVCRL